MKNLIVFAVHPDDETLGSGGTLLKFKRDGYKIHWVIMTTMDEVGYSSKTILERKREIEKVSKQYGFTSTTVLPFKTTSLETYPYNQIVQEVSSLVKKIKPETIIIPHRGDIHSDHRVAYDCLIPLSKSFRYPYIKRILCMEVLSETNISQFDVGNHFSPNYYVDISAFLEQKIRVMKIYKSEIRKHPYPRSPESLKALAILRGSETDLKYAESFQVLKIVL